MGLNLIVSWGRVSFSVGMCILNCAAVEGAAYSLNALNCGCKKINGDNFFLYSTIDGLYRFCKISIVNR